MKQQAAEGELLVKSLQTMANRLRRHSLISTAEAGSGHPSSCFSCADLISTIFFHFLRFEVQDPRTSITTASCFPKGMRSYPLGRPGQRREPSLWKNSAR